MPSNLVLAYLGDAIYELKIREELIKNISKPKDLQKASLNYVSAKAQRRHLERLQENGVLTEQELDIIRQGRNEKGHTNKNSDIVTYRLATGLETLFGYLYLNKQTERIDELISLIVGEEC